MICFRLGTHEVARVQPTVAIVAGYTGRDDAAIRAHINELREGGVEVPASVPTFYAVSPDMLSRAKVLSTTVANTSGEVEFAIVRTRGEFLVALASDHTDRTAELTDVGLSKRLCPKVISRRAWKLQDVLAHWDRLQLSSWTGCDGDLEPYQRGCVDQLLHPLNLLERIPWHSRPGEYIVLGGTIPTISGLRVGGRFRAELCDPVLQRRISLEYRVSFLNPLDA